MSAARRQKGAVALEFALVAPVALLLLFGIVYLGLLATYSGLAEHGVRKAARFAGIRDVATGTYPSDTDIRLLGAKVDPILGTPTTVTVTRKGGSGASLVTCDPTGGPGLRRCGDGDVVTVTATYDAKGLVAMAALPGFPGDGVIIRTATARFE